MDSSEIAISLVSRAEDHFGHGDYKGAMKLIEQLMCRPNSSSNHVMFSRYHVAYSVHSSVSGGRTHYETLFISDPFLDQEAVTRQYRRVSAWLQPSRNPSAAAGPAFLLANAAWFVLSDPARRRAYDVEMGLVNTAAAAGRPKRSGFAAEERPEKMARPSAVEFL